MDKNRGNIAFKGRMGLTRGRLVTSSEDSSCCTSTRAAISARLYLLNPSIPRTRSCASSGSSSSVSRNGSGSGSSSGGDNSSSSSSSSNSFTCARCGRKRSLFHTHTVFPVSTPPPPLPPPLPPALLSPRPTRWAKPRVRE